MPLIDIAHANEETTATTEAGTEGVFHSLGIKTSDIISQGINFIIIACIIWFLILKPVTKKMS
jgi:large-conductance mechanosensitive channel